MPIGSKKIILVAILVLLLVGAVLTVRLFNYKKNVEVSTSQPEKVAPLPKRNIPFGGNVLSIIPEKLEMTIGIYRVENNKPVLADQQIVQYTRETSFVRQVVSLGGKTTTVKISDRDVKAGDTVFVAPGIEDFRGQIIAAEVSLINPPPPPRR